MPINNTNMWRRPWGSEGGVLRGEVPSPPVRGSIATRATARQGAVRPASSLGIPTARPAGSEGSEGSRVAKRRVPDGAEMAWCANASTGGKRRSLANSATTPGKVGRDLQYAASLPLYLKPPEGEVAIEDFELLALERLKGARRLEGPVPPPGPAQLIAFASAAVLKSLEEARSKNTKEPELRVRDQPGCPRAYFSPPSVLTVPSLTRRKSRKTSSRNT